MTIKIFNIDKLSKELQKLEFIDFAYLFGSSSDGIINEGSDLDIAVYFSDDFIVDFDTIAMVLKVIDDLIPGIECDLCRLNTANETLCFEALKGKLLFVKNECKDKFAGFYSITCREYEDYSFWSNKQLEYRGILT